MNPARMRYFKGLMEAGTSRALIFRVLAETGLFGSRPLPRFDMTPRLTLALLRTLFVIAVAVIGGMIGEGQYNSFGMGVFYGLVFAGSMVLTDRLLKGLTLRIFSSATLGLLLGFIAASLVRGSEVLAYLPRDKQWIISLLIYAAFGFLGTMLAIRSNRDEFSMLIPYVRFTRQAVQDAPLLVDTNILIDGRVQAVCAAGFLSSSLVVSRFVLEELQQLADSGDALKRERGKRGLDNLEKMRRLDALDVTIHDSSHEVADDVPTDARLINLAKFFQSRLLTNDSNLARVARMQGISVLNLNDLANAMRPALAVGDELELTLVKEGRDAHQAIGYLADGTMIVVNHARAHLGETVPVAVSSALQTSAGRLIFAELRGGGGGRRMKDEG